MIQFKNQRNPILPVAYHIPDSEAHVMSDGELYVYGSYDDRDDAYCSDKYHVVSTGDMKNWTFYDESLNGSQVHWFNNPDAPEYPGIDWTQPTPFIKKMMADMPKDDAGMKEAFENKEKPPLLFAPDCIEKDGKYYLYFCLADDSEGVAVSDRPQGPFTDLRQMPCGGIDPAIFIDDDGQAYYYWGQLFSHGVKLNPDMVSFDQAQVKNNLVTEEKHFFHEGSSMRKIGDTYYYVYADMERGKPTSLGYATGKSPLGPFTYRGIIIDNDGCDPQSWNNHGSIECIDGQWYVFYHRCSRNSQLHRRLCIEKITVMPDGSIPEVKMTSQGIGEPFVPGEEMFAYQACGLRGTCYIDVNADTDTKDAYPEKIVHISAGDEVIFRYIQSENGFTKCAIRGCGDAKIAISLKNKDGQTINAGMAELRDGVQISADIQAPAGEYELVLHIGDCKNFELLSVMF